MVTLVAWWINTLMSRTRSTNFVDDYHGPFDWSQYDTYGNKSGTLVTDYQDTHEKVIVDSVTPGYYKLVKTGGFLPINSVEISSVRYRFYGAHSGSANYKTAPSPGGVVGYSGSFYYPIGSTHLDPAVIDSDKVDLVVIHALASAKEPDFDVLTFFGEFGDTVRLFKATFGRFTKVSSRIAKKARHRADMKAYKEKLLELRRRGIFVTPQQKRAVKLASRADRKSVIDEFNQLWLEARYGWRPLVYDVQSLMSLLKDKADNELASKSAQLAVNLSAEESSVLDNGNIRYERTVTRTGTATYHAKVYYKDHMSAIGANPIITAYELTRFSFVMDWFINVGSWLQAMSPREGYTELGISTSVKFDYTDTFIQTCSEGSGHTHNVSLTPSELRTNVLKYVRNPYSSIPLPHVNVNLNPFKVLDLIALLLGGRRTVIGNLRL